MAVGADAGLSHLGGICRLPTEPALLPLPPRLCWAWGFCRWLSGSSARWLRFGSAPTVIQRGRRPGKPRSLVECLQSQGPSWRSLPLAAGHCHRAGGRGAA